jgi:hypothetical protein
MTTIKSSEFTHWFATAKPGDKIIYYSGSSFVEACEKNLAIDKLRDAIWTAGFEKIQHAGERIHLIDKGALYLVQRRIGPKPEGKACGTFEYLAIRRGRP